VSHTTRTPREGEEEGIAYHFVDPDAFAGMISRGLFLEHARVFDHYYGTSGDWVEEQLAAGVSIILDIDWQGARQIKSRFADAVSIFILPPTYDTLQQRLIKRNDGGEVIQRRMQDAKTEISHYAEFDFVVINDEFDRALSALAAIILTTAPAARHRPAFLKDFVADLVAGKD